MAQAVKLAEVSNIYRTESYRFVDAYFVWLEEAEKDLAPLRTPISILLQAEKSTLASVLDGYLPSDIQEGKSVRKGQKAVAAQSLEKISREIYSKIENSDLALDQLNEKLCHAIAVLASKEPELYKSLSADQRGADKVWRLLGTTPETVPMFNYFSAKLASADRNYLLFDIIQNVVGNKIVRSKKKKKESPP